MKVYEVYVSRVSEDGYPMGEERVAVVSSRAKAAAKVEAFRAEHEVHQWWMSYGHTDDRQHIRMRVEGVEVE